MTPGSPRHVLLKRLISRLGPEARIALCCAGKYLARHAATLQGLLGPRRVVCVLDDAPEPNVPAVFRRTPVIPLAHAQAGDCEAVLITSDRVEDRAAARLAPLAAAGVDVLRTARVERNPGVTPELLEELLDDAALDLDAGPTPWTRPLPHQPLFTGVEVNNTCNLNCRMCATHAARRPRGQMSLELFEHALDQLDSTGCKQLTLHTVGEPTLHKEFAELLRRSHARAFDLFLSTNGMLLERHFDALRRWPPATIRFSVDGATRATYERIRVGGSFPTLLRTLRGLHALIGAHDLPTSVEMDVTLTRENVGEIPLFFEVYSTYVDDDAIRFHPVDSLAADEDDYYRSARLVTADRLLAPCPALWEECYIGYDGRVSACCRDYHGELIIGDVRDQTLAEIWRGPRLAALREVHLGNDTRALPPPCRRCFAVRPAVADLLNYMITALRRSGATESPPDFHARLSAFLTRLEHRAIHGDVGDSRQADAHPTVARA